MISNHLSLVEHHRPKSNELALLQAEWLGKGGTIEVLEGPSFRPPPPRHDPPPKPKLKGEPIRHNQSKTSFYEDAFAERMKFVSSIREMAKTMTVDQAMAATGRSESTMRRAAFEGDFAFQSKVIDRERDLKLVERLSALRDVGLSRRVACEQVKISPQLLSRLEQDYDFVYPKRWSKPVSQEDL